MPRIIMRGFQVSGEAFTKGMNLFLDVISGGPATPGNEIVISAVVTDFLAYNDAGDQLVWG